jgi:MFS family permease
MPDSDAFQPAIELPPPESVVPADAAQSLPATREQTAALLMLFGAMYFIQGIAEPTEGLLAQPVRTMLDSWGKTTAQIGVFMALLGLPWSIKPLYGLLTDAVPFLGTRRRGYLLVTTAATVLGMAWVYFFPVPSGAIWLLLALMLVPSIGIAFSDVCIDAYMIEKGQPRGLTGQLQSVQWACLYGSGLLVGVVGGYLSEHGLQETGFLICAVATLASLALVWTRVREPSVRRQPGQLREAAAALLQTAKNPALQAAAAFLFLWCFNPFNLTVLQMYATKELGLGEQFYGGTRSLFAAGSIAGSIAYAFYCRRVPFHWLIHGSIVAGALSTLGYAAMNGPTSAAVVSVAVGFFYMTGNMVTLDLSARTSPLVTCGTTFALLMALMNFSVSLSTALGGWLYDEWGELWGRTTAFQLLVVTGAAFTCGCWLLVPVLQRAAAEALQ